MPARATTGATDTTPRVCPECGSTTWKTIPLVVDKSDAGDQVRRQKELDAIVAKRGELQKCAGCGYKAHANDTLEPAAV